VDTAKRATIKSFLLLFLLYDGTDLWFQVLLGLANFTGLSLHGRDYCQGKSQENSK